VRHPEYYLGRADATRALARHVVGVKARRVLEDFAKTYEHMAEEAKSYWSHIDAMLESQVQQ